MSPAPKLVPVEDDSARCPQSGNGALELLLFSPLALFFLIVVVDAGVFLYEKAALANAFRAGVSSQATHTDRHPLSVDEYFSISLDEIALSDTLDGIVGEVSRNIRAIKTPTGVSNYRIEARGVMLTIDEQTGAVLNHSLHGRAHSSGSFNITREAPQYPYTSMSRYLEKTLQPSASSRRFGTPVGPVIDPQTGTVSNKYHPRSLAIYVELTALTDGIGASSVKGSLGEYFAIQQQELTLSRLQTR